MMNRLRLLWRFSYLEASSSGAILPCTTRRDLYTLSSPTRRERRGQRIKYIPSLPLGRRREEDGFCTRAMETEQSQLFRPYLSVRIRCSKDVADTFSEALLCFGAGSTSIDEIISEDLCETWITSLFADGQDVHTCISLAANSICLKYVPEYEVSKGNISPNRSHRWSLDSSKMERSPLLKRLIKGGEKFLDYGTGSGVLGIAALKMGAEFSVGIDVDPQAVASALQNIALNEIETDNMRVYLVSGVGSSNIKELSAVKLNFDIVIANILLNPLLELADDIASYGRPGAVIGLSGIISEQIGQIKEHFSSNLDDISVAEMDGWACVHGIKRVK